MFFIMSTRPATLKSSPTTGSIQSEYIAPTRPKWSRKLNAAMIVSVQSIWRARPPFTESGSCGRGCTGGGATNWKRNVVLADDDLAARFLGELHLVGAADLLRLAAERLRCR